MYGIEADEVDDDVKKLLEHVDDEVEDAVVILDQRQLPIEVEVVDDDIKLLLIADVKDEIDVNEFLFLGIL